MALFHPSAKIREKPGKPRKVVKSAASAGHSQSDLDTVDPGFEPAEPEGGFLRGLTGFPTASPGND